MSTPSPKTVLRIMVNVCLVGAGVSAIGQARRAAAPGFGPLVWLHDLQLFFFFSLLAFGLFFVEYQIFQGMTKRDLNVSLGYLQALGCTLLVLCGLWGIYYSTRQGPVAATSSAGFPETILLIIYIFGHAVFVANIVWSYLAERRTA
ncbi:MAG TPA: hypothetical protein VIH97_15490 [Candidatus Acidoferrales bacterium]